MAQVVRPKAAVAHPADPNRFWFFSGEYYVYGEFEKGAAPKDRLLSGPTRIVDGWKSLAQAGFTTVDAILPDPLSVIQFYVFSGDQCALINTIDEGQDILIEGPKPIGEMLPAIAHAKLKKVDACYVVPGIIDTVYFFADTNYIRAQISLPTASGALKDNYSSWASLKTCGWKTVDTVFPIPGSDTDAYYFSGDSVAVISTPIGSLSDHVTTQPVKIVNSPGWNCLKVPGFW